VTFLAFFFIFFFFGRNWSTSKNNSIKESRWIHPSELPVNGFRVIYLLEAMAIDCFSHTHTHTQTGNKIERRRMKGGKKRWRKESDRGTEKRRQFHGMKNPLPKTNANSSKWSILDGLAGWLCWIRPGRSCAAGFVA
jgi:hypothetical protein